jgi:hypothetical protein
LHPGGGRRAGAACGQGGIQPFTPLAQVTVDEPEAAEGRPEPQRHIHRALRNGPAQRLAEIIVLLLQPGQPGLLRGLVQLRRGVLGQGQVGGGVAVVDCRGLFRKDGQLLGGVLAYQFVQFIAPAGGVAQERLLHQCR